MNIDDCIAEISNLSNAKRLHNKNCMLLYKTFRDRELMTPQEYEAKQKRYGRLCKKYSAIIDSYVSSRNIHLNNVYAQYTA